MTDQTTKQKGHFRRNWFFYLLIISSLGFSAFLWLSRTAALNKQAKNLQIEKELFQEKAQESFKINSDAQLALMLKTFSWAVRAELIRGNEDQVNQYFNQLVKNEKIDEITLVDTEGKILISTNKKNQGNTLKTEYAESVLNIDDLKIINLPANTVLAAPVLSLDSHLGTLILLCNKEMLDLTEV